MKGTGKGGDWGGGGEPVWHRTRASSTQGIPGWGASSATSRRFGSDGFDELRLGRPRLHMSVPAARVLAAAIVLANAAPLLLHLAWFSSSGGGSSPLIAMTPFSVAMASGLLASCRTERDVQAGRRAAWAYPWDWIQLSFLLLAAGTAWVLGDDPLIFGFASTLTLLLGVTVRAMYLRRRRARAAWSTEAVDATFE